METSPLIDFWIFGPERGCLMREVPIIRQLAVANIRFRIFAHKDHKSLIQSSLKDLSFEFIPYRFGLSLKYTKNYDIAIFRTLISLAQYVFFVSISHYSLFRKNIKKQRPTLIVNDFLPLIPIFAHLHKLPIAGVYNYRLHYTGLGESFFHRMLSWGVHTAFTKMYALHQPMLIEQIYPQPFEGHTIEIPIIARSVVESKTSVLAQLNLQKDETNIYLSLGGGATKINKQILNVFSDIGSAQNWNIILHPRNKYEMEWLGKHYPQFTLVPYDWVETQDILQCASVVVARAGFTTVAECLKLNIPLVLWHMEKHPEIRETENFLKENNLCAGIIHEHDAPDTIAKTIKQGLHNDPLLDKLNLIQSDGDLHAKTLLMKALRLIQHDES